MTATARPRHAERRPRRRPLATVARIASQLRGDPRTIALVLVMPVVLLTLLYFVFVDVPTPPGVPSPFDTIGPIMLAVLPMMLMFIVTSVVMLRERTSGTLERILTTPLTRWNLVASYATVFGLLALVQASILGWLILGPMDAHVEGQWPALLLLAVLDALFGVAFGLLASAFARNEFQAVQFMPLFVGPQIILCGLFVAPEQMPDALGTFASWLPMTWAVDVVRDIIDHPELGDGSWLRLGGLAVAVVLALALASRSMPRKTR